MGQVAAVVVTVAIAYGLGLAPPAFARAAEPPPGGETVSGDQDNKTEPDAQPETRYVRLDLLLSIPIVTASGGAEEDSAMAPANVVAVTSQEITAHGWQSLAEILENVLGLYVIDDLVQPSVGVRGVTGGLRGGTRMIKVMIDGVEVNFRPDLSAFIGPEYIPVEAIARVEIAKGPLSALYGANAFVATVNVITKKADPGAHWSATLRGNQHAGQIGYGGAALLGYGAAKRELLLAVTFDRIDRSGLTIQRTFDQDVSLPRFQPYFGRVSANDLSRPLGVYGKFSNTFERAGTLLARGGLQHQDALGEFQPNSVYTRQSRYSVQNAWLNLRHEGKWTDIVETWASVGAAAGAPTSDERLFVTSDDSGYFNRKFGYRSLDSSAGASLTVSPRLTLDLGVDHSYEDHDTLYFRKTYLRPVGSNNPGDTEDQIQIGDRTSATLQNFGVRLQATGRPLADVENLRVSGNLRLDLPNYFPVQWSWRGAVAYRWTSSFVTKLVAGRAFQAPSAVLMFGIPGFGASNIIGNFTLPGRDRIVPQVVESAELVASFTRTQMAIDLAAFAQRVDRKIEFVQVGQNFLATNQGLFRNGGFELTARFNVGPVEPYASGALQWSLLADPGDGSRLSFEPTPLYPNAVGTVGVTAQISRAHLRGNTQVRWVGERGASQSNRLLNNDTPYRLAPYATWDVSLSTVGLRWLGEESETTFAIMARNLLDNRVSDPGFNGFDTPLEGRVVLLEVRQSF